MKHNIGVLAGVLFVAVLQTAFAQKMATPEHWSGPVIQVRDKSGAPLPASEAAMVWKDSPIRSFKMKMADTAGEIKFTREDFLFPKVTEMPSGDMEVLVLSAGKAPALVPLFLPADGPITVNMEDGETVTVSLSAPTDAPLPEDLVPRIYPEKFGTTVWPSKERPIHASPWVNPVGNGQFSVTLAETTAPWSLLIHEPDYLQAYTVDFFTASAIANKSIQFELPKAGSIAHELLIPENLRSKAAATSFTLTALYLLELGSEARIYLDASEVTLEGTLESLRHTHNNLAPGRYWVTSSEHPAIPGSMETALFRDGQSTTVPSDGSTSVTATYQVFDMEKLKGNITVNISVKKIDGSPAAGLEYELRFLDRDFGYIPLTTGTLDELGKAQLSGLAGGDESAPVYRLSDHKAGNSIGQLKLDTDESSRNFDFQLPPKAGDIAPDITLADLYTKEPVKLSDFKGQIVFLDFWATWCGPCQEPMEHNQKMLTSNESAWKDKVVIVGASIDTEAQTVVNHVKTKGWDKIRHLWAGQENWSSDAVKAYGVTGVPTVLLIDANGKIIYRGHPAGVDLEDEVAKLLQTQ